MQVTENEQSIFNTLSFKSASRLVKYINVLEIEKVTICID